MLKWGRPRRPTAQDAAKRLLVLRYVAVYALTTPPREMMKQWLDSWSDADRKEFEKNGAERRAEVWGSLERAGLSAAMSPKEREFARSAIITMTDRQQLDGIWRLEAVQTIMWALGLLSVMPDFDIQADGEILNKAPIIKIPEFISNARLRPNADIDAARDYAEFWHWRSRTRELIERGEEFNTPSGLKAQGIHGFDDLVRFVAKKSASEGRLRPIIDEDFGAKGKAFRDLTEEEWSEVRSITLERHFALDWLCGYAPGNRWDDTPTDT
jgi:hypothetical protein